MGPAGTPWEVFSAEAELVFQGDRKAITLRLLADSGLNACRASELEPEFSF